MSKKDYLCVGLVVLASAMLFLTSIFIYSVFVVPEFVYVHAVYDGSLKITTEPNDLLQKGRISRWTSVFIDLKNETEETCEGSIKAKLKNNGNSFEFGPKDSDTSGNGGLYRPQDGKIEIELCGKSEILNLR